MTIYTFPDLSIPAPNTFQWGSVYNTQKFESPITKSVQTLESPGMRWKCSMGYESLLEEDAALLESFIMKLRGQAGRFYLHNFSRPVPRGTVGGSPKVNNESASPTELQTGNSLITNGWSAGSVLKEGDYFSFNNELKMVKANATADGSGNMTITFEPPIRSSPAHLTDIVTTKPKCIMMLTDDTNIWQKEPGVYSTISIDCVEVFS